MQKTAAFQSTFRPFGQSNLDFAKLAANYANRHSSGRILDIGCGTGETLFILAEMLPDAQFLGIDISAANIALARERLKESGDLNRMTFAADDYLKTPLERRDLIVSNTCLHLIPGNTEQLMGKVSNELESNGFLIYSMPYSCFYNSFLWSIRKILRSFRSKWTDRFIYMMGLLLHRGDVNRDLLLERIPYMYLLPYRVSNTEFLSLLHKQFNLQVVEIVESKHSSLAQPYHHTVVLQKA